MAKCAHCQQENEGWVPVQTHVDERKKRDDRIAELTRSLETTKGQLTEISEKWAAAQPQLGELETFKSKVAELEGQSAGWALERSIIRAGITSDEGVQFARMAWDAMPQEKRPQGGIDAWLSDPDSLPMGVRAYLPPGQPAGSTQAPNQGQATTASPQAAAPQQPAAGGGVPRTSTTVVPAGGQVAQPKFTREQIRAMSPEEYQANEAAILAQLGLGS